MLNKSLFVKKLVTLSIECRPNEGVRDVFELVHLSFKFENGAVAAGNDRLVFIVKQACSLKVDMDKGPLRVFLYRSSQTVEEGLDLGAAALLGNEFYWLIMFTHSSKETKCSTC